MPLYKTIEVTNNTKIYIWKIEETLEELQRGVALSEFSALRFKKMKTIGRQKEFLAVRQLFKQAGYHDKEVVYDDLGKPHLTNGKYLSVTHSFNYCAIIVSSVPVGIDIEKQRDKIVRLAYKFTDIESYEGLNSSELIEKLTIVWGAKEGLYKLYGKKHLAFKDINIKDFDLQSMKTIGYIAENSYTICYFKLEDFVCVYVK